MKPFLHDTRLADGLTAHRDGKTLVAVFHSNASLRSLEHDARRALGPLPITTGMMWLLGILLGLALGAVVIVFLGFLEVFYDLFKQVALRLSIPDNRLELAYLVLVLLIGSAIVSFLPQIFSGGSKGFGNDVLRRLIDNEQGVIDRIARRTSVAALLGRIDGISRLASRYYAEFTDLLERYGTLTFDRPAAMDRMCQLAIRYHLQFAWIIVSGRIAAPGFDAGTAERSLSLVGDVL